MNEQGIMEGDRYIALATRDYNGMAGNLAGRANMNGKPSTAYERSYVGPVAGFETYKMDAGKRITAAAGGGSITIATNGAQADFVPAATSTGTGGQINVDNRYQTVTVSSTTSVAAGDAFTIAGVEAVHHITKESTGQLKTFRVISVDSGTTMTISPPIIGATSSPTDAELAYKNCEVVTESATSAIVWLNTTTAPANPFWHKDSIEILPWPLCGSNGSRCKRAAWDNRSRDGGCHDEAIQQQHLHQSLHAGYPVRSGQHQPGNERRADVQSVLSKAGGASVPSFPFERYHMKLYRKINGQNEVRTVKPSDAGSMKKRGWKPEPELAARPKKGKAKRNADKA